MAFNMLRNIFSGGDSVEDNKQIVMRALNKHGLTEYRETSLEVDRLIEAIETAPTKMQKREHKELLSRYQCRQNALRGAAVVLAAQLDQSESEIVYRDFAITEQDHSKVSSGITDPRQCPAHELARYFIEESENDFVMAGS